MIKLVSIIIPVFNEVDAIEKLVENTQNLKNLGLNFEYEIIIVDDMIYLSEGGFAVLGGGALCCISLIGIIIGVILMSRKKPTTIMMVQHPGQLQNFQQMPFNTSVQPEAQPGQEGQEPVWNFPKNP